MTSDADERARARRLEQLLQRKLGSLLSWKRPDLVETIGPHLPSAFDKFDLPRREIIAQCQAKLDQYSDTEIFVLVDGGHDDPDGISRDWKLFRSREIDALRKRIPFWYAGGFGHPDYAADFEYWCKMPRFSVEEALCLSIGVEPKNFEKNHLLALGKLKEDRLSEPIAFLLRRYEQLKRQFDPAGHGWGVAPAEFLDWAHRVRFDVHPEFSRLLSSYHGTSQGAHKASGDQTKPDKREIDSIAQLFTAMAIDYLGYKPRAAKSPIPKQITELAATMGMNISEKTVRKYLSRGAEFIPEDWEPQ